MGIKDHRIKSNQSQPIRDASQIIGVLAQSLVSLEAAPPASRQISTAIARLWGNHP